MIGFDKGNCHAARIRDDGGDVHRQGMNPFSIDSQHMDYQVSCALRAVNGAALPVRREVCVMIRMGMSVGWLSTIVDQTSSYKTHVKKYAVTLGIVP